MDYKNALRDFLAQLSDEELSELGVRRNIYFKEKKIDFSNFNSESKELYTVLISDILKKLGIPMHTKGYRYILEAIYISLKDPSCLDKLIERIYTVVGEKYNETWGKVARCIRYTIKNFICNANPYFYKELFLYSIPSGKDAPSNGQFIANVVEYIQNTYEKPKGVS